MIDEHAVELLRHRPVKGAHPGFHVSDRNPRLCPGQRAGQGRVGVTVDEHRVRSDLLDHRLERCQLASCLGGVRAARDAQLAVRSGDAELCEEHRAQVVVEMLAGVDQHLIVHAA